MNAYDAVERETYAALGSISGLCLTVFFTVLWYFIDPTIAGQLVQFMGQERAAVFPFFVLVLGTVLGRVAGVLRYRWIKKGG